MNVICWFSTNWPFSPSLAAAAQLLCIFNECVSCYFWPGRSPHKHSHSTVFPFSLSLCVSVCVQMWLMWKVAKKKSMHMYLSCSCACCSVWVCPLQLIYDTACTNACLHALDKMLTTCVCVCVEERESERERETECVCTCVWSRCPVFRSVPQTGWSLLLLPRADGPGHVLLCLPGQATPPPL